MSTTAPLSLLASFAADGATEVASAADIRLLFNAPIARGSGPADHTLSG